MIIRNDLIDFLKAIIHTDEKKPCWFDNRPGLCYNWNLYTLNVLGENSDVDIQSALMVWGIDWRNWPQYSGDFWYPIPTEVDPKACYLKLLDTGKLWEGEQLELRIDLCRWLLERLEQ